MIGNERNISLGALRGVAIQKYRMATLYGLAMTEQQPVK